MAENKRPLIAVGAHSMHSQNQTIARMQLITPPPEEILRKTPENTGTSSNHISTATKRKRTHSMNQDNNLGIQYPQLLYATSNPKSRKQGRIHSRQPSFGSPTRTPLGNLGPPPVSNDDISKRHTPLSALVLPPAKAPGPLRRVLLGAKSSIPPYEPPIDVFTPPRVVFLTPVLTKYTTKSSKRKPPALASGSKSTKGKKKGSTLTILTAVKQEMPDIDLSLPMPPPSPSDDPLLLSGPHKSEVTDENMMQLGPDDAGISPVRLFGQQQEKVKEEEREVCQISIDPDDEEPASLFDNLVPLQEVESSLVKTTSEDPRPAARAAAIQKEEGPEVHQISIDLDDEKPASPFDDLVPFQEEELSLVKTTSVDPCVAARAATIQEEEGPEVHQISIDLDDEGPASPFNLVPLQGEELSLMKTNSTDPRATTRAAAIPKQHDYDCYTNIGVKRRHLEAKHRRNSHSDVEEFAKESRRRDVSSSGVAKASISSRHRRSTSDMGVINDTVFIPGNLATTLPELLQEAEHEVRVSPQSLNQMAGRADSFKAPVAAKYRTERATTWMADEKAEVFGSVGEQEWTEEDWKHLDACFTDQMLEVGSRLAGAEQDLPVPVDIVSIDDVVDKFMVSKGGFDTVARFGTLWSRENLLERTRALQEKQRSEHISTLTVPTTPYTSLSVEAQDNFPQLETEDTSSDVLSTTIGKRVKGFLFSYLPTLPKSSSAARKTPIPLHPSLPVPPIDILSKPRGPVITPARAPLSKPKHPKELVFLHPAPQLSKISHIPRMFKPRRLVELRPPAPLPIVEPPPIPRPRRSSGNSVKDLVRGFEELQTLTHDQLKLTKNNEGSKRYADRRPRWKF